MSNNVVTLTSSGDAQTNIKIIFIHKLVHWFQKCINKIKAACGSDNKEKC